MKTRCRVKKLNYNIECMPNPPQLGLWSRTPSPFNSIALSHKNSDFGPQNVAGVPAG